MEKGNKRIVKLTVVIVCLLGLSVSLYFSFKGYGQLESLKGQNFLSFSDNFEHKAFTIFYILFSLGMSFFSGLVGASLMISRKVVLQCTSLINGALNFSVFLFWLIVFINSVLFTSGQTQPLL